MSLEEALQNEIRKEVNRQIEEKLPEIIRALGIKEAEPEAPTSVYIDAVEVARLLGRDLSSPENIRKAKKHVYHLAAQNLIPCVRLSERNIKFERAKVLQAIQAKENKAA